MGFVIPPDWLCEVLSPSTGRLDRVRKLPIHAREGVQWVWLVDPKAETVEVLELADSGRWAIARVVGGREMVRLPPFEAIEIDLATLWADPPPAGGVAEQPAEQLAGR